MPQRCFDAVLKVELCHDSPTETSGDWVAHTFRRCTSRQPWGLRELRINLQSLRASLTSTSWPAPGAQREREADHISPGGFPACTKPSTGREETQAAPLTLAALELKDSKDGRKDIYLRDHCLIDISFELFLAVSTAFAAAPLQLQAWGRKLGHYKIKARIQHLQNCAPESCNVPDAFLPFSLSDSFYIKLQFSGMPRMSMWHSQAGAG